MATNLSENYEFSFIEESYGILDVKDAIFRLYEEIFESRYEIDKHIIYKALRYLLWKNDMHEQYENICELNEDEVCVEHAHKINLRIENEVEDWKHKILNLLEE